MRVGKAGRFTAWFSATERTALETEARLNGDTLNYVVRKAVRRHLGKEKLMAAAEKLDHHVTQVTRNDT